MLMCDSDHHWSRWMAFRACTLRLLWFKPYNSLHRSKCQIKCIFMYRVYVRVCAHACVSVPKRGTLLHHPLPLRRGLLELMIFS